MLQQQREAVRVVGRAGAAPSAVLEPALHDLEQLPLRSHLQRDHRRERGEPVRVRVAASLRRMPRRRRRRRLAPLLRVPSRRRSKAAEAAAAAAKASSAAAKAVSEPAPSAVLRACRSPEARRGLADRRRACREGARRLSEEACRGAALPAGGALSWRRLRRGGRRRRRWRLGGRRRVRVRHVGSDWLAVEVGEELLVDEGRLPGEGGGGGWWVVVVHGCGWWVVGGGMAAEWFLSGKRAARMRMNQMAESRTRPGGMSSSSRGVLYCTCGRGIREALGQGALYISQEEEEEKEEEEEEDAAASCTLIGGCQR